MLAHHVHRHRLQRTVIYQLKLLRSGEPAEVLVFRKRTPARRHLETETHNRGGTRGGVVVL